MKLLDQLPYIHKIVQIVDAIMYYLYNLYYARIVTDLQSQKHVHNPILVPCIFQVVPPRPCMTSVTMTTSLHYIHLVVMFHGYH